MNEGNTIEYETLTKTDHRFGCKPHYNFEVKVKRGDDRNDSYYIGSLIGDLTEEQTEKIEMLLRNAFIQGKYHGNKVIREAMQYM